MGNNKSNVFIICTGLGHINRGYETFTMECFNALKTSPDFELFLLKGAGRSYEKEFTILCAKRNTKLARFLAKIIRKGTYWIEQFTFLIGMLPYLIKYKPKVIYYSDFILGTFLFHLRSFFKFKYKLLFSNGAPNGPPYKTEDHIQQLLTIYAKEAIEKGTPPDKQTLLPYGFDININERLLATKGKDTIREALGFAPEQKIILSVGAINKHHKRMDYLINEVAKLPANYFLVILGQFEDETEELLNLAAGKLNGRHLITSIPSEEVKNYYIASDFFVLASLKEGFGRVLIEALSYGLPCIVNNHANAIGVLGEYGEFIDMEGEGVLATTLLSEKSSFSKEQRIEASYNLYSWDRLKEKYAAMITKLID